MLIIMTSATYTVSYSRLKLEEEVPMLEAEVLLKLEVLNPNEELTPLVSEADNNSVLVPLCSPPISTRPAGDSQLEWPYLTSLTTRVC